MSKTQNYTAIAILMQTISNATSLFIHLKILSTTRFLKDYFFLFCIYSFKILQPVSHSIMIT